MLAKYKMQQRKNVTKIIVPQSQSMHTSAISIKVRNAINKRFHQVPEI